ncbi:MAG: DUF1232 domain-containing protein [Paludibacteraceae bacterium]|nr:DUF1232 domain-containing protein [Paludibacteraceae bacterium]
MNDSKFEKAYSEKSFWEKLGKYAKEAGKELVINALKLYYAIALGKANVGQIATIMAALGYFISPADVIPDLLPGGYADDAGVIAAAVGLLACCSDKEVVAAAKTKAAEWFD